MADKTYIAQRDRLKVSTGFIHTGESYPAGEVTAALLSLGWVTEGNGELPGDAKTFAAFADPELAALGGERPTEDAPADEPFDITDVKIADLAAYLQEVTDPAQVAAFAADDPRSTAAEIYQARLDELAALDG